MLSAAWNERCPCCYGHARVYERCSTLRPAPGGLQLDVEEVVHCYQHAKRRLLVLGYNSTLTTSVEAPRQQAKRTFEQMQARSSHMPLSGQIKR